MDEKVKKIQEDNKDMAFKFLIESVNKSTKEAFDLREREILLLKKLLDAEKKITFLIGELAKEKYPSEQEDSDSE